MSNTDNKKEGFGNQQQNKGGEPVVSLPAPSSNSIEQDEQPEQKQSFLEAVKEFNKEYPAALDPFFWAENNEGKLLEVQKIFLDKGLELHLTCQACPEQYEVFLEGTKVQAGYLRLRHGSFRVDYPDCGGETIYEASPKGDGIFENDERAFFLSEALQAITKKLNSVPNPEECDTTKEASSTTACNPNPSHLSADGRMYSEEDLRDAFFAGRETKDHHGTLKWDNSDDYINSLPTKYKPTEEAKCPLCRLPYESADHNQNCSNHLSKGAEDGGNGWISVEKELPEENVLVLIGWPKKGDKEGYVTYGKYAKGDNNNPLKHSEDGFVSTDGWIYVVQPTHWQPLPQSPIVAGRDGEELINN